MVTKVIGGVAAELAKKLGLSDVEIAHGTGSVEMKLEQGRCSLTLRNLSFAFVAQSGLAGRA